MDHFWMTMTNKKCNTRTDNFINFQNFNLIQRPIPQKASNGVGPDQQAPVLPPKHQQPPPYRPAPTPPSSQLLMPPIAEDNVYLNGGGAGGRATFHLGTAVGPIGPIGPAGAGKFFSMAPPMGTACSSEGSHDSHNDSGYCVRPGGGSISGGPSPSLSGNMRTVNERIDFLPGRIFLWSFLTFSVKIISFLVFWLVSFMVQNCSK